MGQNSKQDTAKPRSGVRLDLTRTKNRYVSAVTNPNTFHILTDAGMRRCKKSQGEGVVGRTGPLFEADMETPQQDSARERQHTRYRLRISE